ncbi:DUF2306 domain-containing protein [Planomicrobium sp. CPCC 101079]|uniref:DUF2306 domain-containing protein n=1 Tax=Planomicrobium sp. CPCC 101079 TaxID=2599618 RepID=UPI0011B848C4|nr:DUF2306 domain-containing protein [Planomicrobium sp. CPCC 101079]TWT09354.1 DUF2306 domain-containing protein [Planomicrobium sp. CPCC 101079]
MNFFTSMLVLHIAAGSVCLSVGLFAVSVKKKKGNHTKSGEVYHASFAVLFSTAVIMALLHWEESAALFYVAIFSYSLAFIGYMARKRRWKNWISLHIRGMLGSYIGLVTAVLITNGQDIPLLNLLPDWSLWLLPTIIGSPIIFYVAERYRRLKKQNTALS